MKGDFSAWRFARRDNFNGVLPQQGRVLLDSDGVADTRIDNDWQDVHAQDTIGSGVAAVPAALPDSFRVDRVRVQGGDVVVTLEPGRVWADGYLLHLDEAAAVDRMATYLEPPIQNPVAVGSIATGVRDAVILELWRESINGFQRPDVLVEAGLGGVDTAERVHTASALRLFRMGADDNCSTIRSRLQDDFSKKGKLKATLQPTVATAGDCPVVEGGGYTGFEHQTYRIEIADVAGGPAMFKFSRFNGGLVGRGVFDAVALRVNITANLAAIATAGLSQFYLEAEELDAARGHWRVTYGAPVTLNASNQLVLPATPTFGAIPASPTAVFFRLWDGIRQIAAFPISGTPTELEDGIRLEFDPVAPGLYAPRDYWVFTVRAGGVGNPNVLINSEPPSGIHYVRVPLAEVTWNAALDVTLASGALEDCREPFHPITRSSSCCTHRVGDGINSHAQFTSIQAAINALPPSGGEVCVLPGVYTENVEIVNRRGIRVHGCGTRSRVVAPAPVRGPALPVFRVTDSRGIALDSMAIVAHADAPGILLTSTGFDASPGLPRNRITKLRNVTLTALQVTAERRAAIEARDGQFIEISRCDIRMKDVPSAWPGVFFQCDDGVIERNQVRVRSARQDDDSEQTFPIAASSGLGGIQIGGGSDRVRIIDNIIQGGIGNGITLGSVLILDPNGRDTGERPGWVINIFDPCNPCKPGTHVFPGDRDDPQRPTRTVSAGSLTEIRIERNRIYDMGLNGIGVVAFFSLGRENDVIEVQDLTILGNHIRGCLRRELEEIPAAMQGRVGYGGIALAAVETLVVWDNMIERNGRRRLDPVCGIFVLFGAGIDICRNHIVGNGARTEEPVTSAHFGFRGGIVIGNAASPMEVVGLVLDRQVDAVESNRPALRVHENIVSAPLGLALYARVLGPVSVVGNQFVSQAVFEPRPDSPTAVAPMSGFTAGAVLIIDVGRSYEIPGFQAGFADVRAGNFTSGRGFAVTEPTNPNTAVLLRPEAMAIDSRRRIAGGQVTFVANQVTLDLIERGPTQGYTSIMIVTLDDVGFEDNHSSARLADDFLLVNSMVVGGATRAVGNRWQEPLPNAVFSAMTFGVMNVTAHNVATHCIVALAPPKLLVKDPNVVLLNEFFDDPCGRTTRLANGFGVGGRN